MPDRRKQIGQLIGSRFDLLWFPAGALRGSSGGEVAGGWKTCETCGGLGEVTRFRKKVACPTCSHTCTRCGGQGFDVDSDEPCKECGTGGAVGTGRVWSKGHKGELHVDAYTGAKTGSAESSASAKPRRRVKCDGCQDITGTPTGALPNGQPCRYCDGTGFRDLHAFDLALDTRDADGQADPIDNAIDRRDNAGSYHQLDLALAAISRHVNKPLRYVALTLNADQARKLLDELYLLHTRTPDEMSLFEQALVELALAYIDERMPDPIVVPRDVTLNERQRQQTLKGGALNGLGRERRDKQIRKWDREGKPRTWIAQQTGLSDRQLREIINGKGVAA